MNALKSRVRILEEKAGRKVGRRLVILWKGADQTEDQVLKDRPDINREDPTIDLIFMQWFGEGEPGNRTPQR